MRSARARWSFDEFSKILDKCIPLKFLGFGPILPPDISAPDFFEAVEFYGPTHADQHPKLKFEIEKREQLQALLAKEKLT